MKKRLLAALLAFIMIAACFNLAGCGNKEEDEDEEKLAGQRVAMTMTLWLQAAEGTEVDDESVAQVEKAINEVTQGQFSTAIKLKVFTADDYDANVAAKLENCRVLTEEADAAAAAKRKAQREAIAKGEEYVEDTETQQSGTEVITFDDEDNKFEAMNAALFATYPALANDQFDIFLIHGYDEFKNLASNFQLSDLYDNLNDKSKILKSYIFPSLLDGAKFEGGVYAVPNNRAVGKYEVMLVNKEIASSLYYDPARLNSVEALFTYDDSGISYIEDVKKSLPGVTPVVGTFSPINIKYWNEKGDGTFSIIASQDNKDQTYEGVVENLNAFAQVNVTNSIYYAKKIKEIAAPGAFNKDAKFAVGFTTATKEEIAEYEKDYQVSVLKYPTPSQDEIFDSMFAVSAYTKVVDRAMEIITLLNTDTNFRTILQYGVEGVHWKHDVDDNKVINILSDKYKMDLKETGNSFITYPDAGRPLSDWQNAKDQNLDSFIPRTNGFNPVNEATAGLFSELTKKSAEFQKKIDGMTADEFKANVASLRDEVAALDCFRKLTYDYRTETDEENPEFDFNESMIYYWFEFLSE